MIAGENLYFLCYCYWMMLFHFIDVYQTFVIDHSEKENNNAQVTNQFFGAIFDFLINDHECIPHTICKFKVKILLQEKIIKLKNNWFSERKICFWTMRKQSRPPNDL